MRIITNYKDYYDHVAFMYGGGDPKIVYVRPHRHKDIQIIGWDRRGRDRWVLIGDSKIKSGFLSDLKRIWNRHNVTERTKHGWVDRSADVMGIVIGNIGFAKIKTEGEGDYRFINEDDLKNTGRYFSKTLKIEEVINYKDDSLVAVCKATGMPVFSFNVSDNYFHIHELMPNLGKLGIPSFISANEMYQHLSYFIGNTMHDSPDTMKPVILSDKIKIEGHGFDYKTSFRNV